MKSKNVEVVAPVEEIVVETPVEAVPVEETPVVAPVKEEQPVDKVSTGSVTAKILAVREKPSVESYMIRVVYFNDTVKYKKVNKDWVELLDGGFCMRKFIQ